MSQNKNAVLSKRFSALLLSAAVAVSCGACGVNTASQSEEASGSAVAETVSGTSVISSSQTVEGIEENSKNLSGKRVTDYSGDVVLLPVDRENECLGTTSFSANALENSTNFYIGYWVGAGAYAVHAGWKKMQANYISRK